ncbi:DUF5710 domain-containing protein [Rhodoferax ferrireducens]|uniref:DUF5710 domain-containing protein n=1 Tax=Rhodoferax ferrireducens TaxID=192843 RepID=UPI000E0D2062|nr:DUF5710 domain-containing protein [Rhodoferax ferrireducens]
MRINLVAPFAEKDAVKALGARWDAASKNWYIIDVKDLTPFLRWIPNAGTANDSWASLDTPKTTKTKTAPVQQLKGLATPKLANEVPHCGCNVQPWEDCKHTANM